MKEFLATALVVAMVLLLPKHYALARIASLFYVVMVLYITLLSRTVDKGIGINIFPFHFLYWMKRYFQAYGFRGLLYPISGIYLNVLLFVPFGYLFKCEKEQMPIGEIVLLGFMFSLFIESLQMIFKIGMFETDDLLSNKIGT